ncbi:EAL domain-containing protein [Asaia astilbis]|uniref:EAL domain-containing protein n=1 Tax=Asaia astilbis TaxID=610244 RepID=UPI0012EBB5D6|nr:EAL domain-containing protein [Asaia astilbis]
MIGWEAELDLAASIKRGRRSLGNSSPPASEARDISLLREICLQAASRIGSHSVTMTLSDPMAPGETFIAALQEILAETGFPPTGLRLTLHERRLADNDREQAFVLAVLIDWGVQIWVARFGQDPSSLRLLRECAASGLISGIGLDAILLKIPTGSWRPVEEAGRETDELLDPVASRFYAASCTAMQRWVSRLTSAESRIPHNMLSRSRQVSMNWEGGAENSKVLRPWRRCPAPNAGLKDRSLLETWFSIEFPDRQPHR